MLIFNVCCSTAKSFSPRNFGTHNIHWFSNKCLACGAATEDIEDNRVPLKCVGYNINDYPQAIEAKE